MKKKLCIKVMRGLASLGVPEILLTNRWEALLYIKNNLKKMLEMKLELRSGRN